MVQIQTMTNYDQKESKIFISLNALLKEIWNMMICAFSLSRRSQYATKYGHKDYWLVPNFADGISGWPISPKGSIISTQFSTQSSSAKF